MKHLTHWILALLALAAFASFSGAWTSVQEPPPKQQPPKPDKERKLEKPAGKRVAQRGRAEKHAAIKKALPTLKTTLGEAIQLAEKETSGKAYSAGLEIMEGKPQLQVNLYAADKFVVVNVDPETKKVTVQAKREGADEAGEGEGEGEDEEGG